MPTLSDSISKLGRDIDRILLPQIAQTGRMIGSGRERECLRRMHDSFRTRAAAMMRRADETLRKAGSPSQTLETEQNRALATETMDALRRLEQTALQQPDTCWDEISTGLGACHFEMQFLGILALSDPFDPIVSP